MKFQFLLFSNVKYMFQDSCSPLMFYISSFHDHVMVVVLFILSLVLYLFFCMSVLPYFSRFFNKSESLEILWTVLPCLVLASLAVPSLFTLYVIEEMVNPILTLKIVGHQWFWSYEYEDFDSIEFDSYLVPVDSINMGDFRLLEVDKHVFIPLNSEIRLVITSMDVIHSWTVPALGVKVDAIPGRLNQLNLFASRLGLFYGQCSEICGSLHAFMPICLESVMEEEFLSFVKNLI